MRRLRRAYDEVLARYDLLLMPTLPMVATPLPEANAPVGEILQRGFEMLANTAPFDCTHHPAMSLPCGMVDGLPVGMMLVGKPMTRRRSTAPRRLREGRGLGEADSVNAEQHVDPKTVQGCLDKAGPGDVIVLDSGRYTEALRLIGRRGEPGRRSGSGLHRAR